jgi:AraC-like DNA-binding protein
MVLNILVLQVGLLGLLTAALLLTKYRSNNMINHYLIITIILVAMRFILTGFYSLGTFINLNELIRSYSQFFILTVPSVYLYIHNLVFNKKNLLYQDLKHFILPIVFSISITKIPGHLSTISSYWKITLFLFLVTYFFYYWYQLVRLLLPPISTKKDFVNLKKEKKQIRNWSLFLLILCSLCLVRVMFSIYIQLFAKNHLTTNHAYIWISGAIWMIIFLKILISPRILYGYSALNDIIKKEKSTDLEFNNIWTIKTKIESKNIQDSKLKVPVNKKILEYISKIEEKALNLESFKEFQFTISDLANQLQIPTSHLTYTFKYHCKIPFSGYKKIIRIRHSILYIKSGYLEGNTLESLAKKVGFASYNPFFSSFKQIIGQSPKEYAMRLND